MPLRRCLLALVLTLGVLPGCASFVENIRPVVFGKTAQENYERGLRSLRGESYQDAARYFNYVKNNYGFSAWATLAELGLADAAFGREAYIEAIDAYKAFMRSHPSHEKTVSGYCAFRIGEAYVKQIPNDLFILPPSYEKDQGPVMDAMREMREFLDQYGKSAYAKRARELYADTVRRLADHELYVANYYLTRKHPIAAIWRLEYVVNHYPYAKRDAEVLMLLGRTYLAQDKPADARDTFRRLTIEHPGDFRAAQAYLYLDHIARRYPNLPAPKAIQPRKIEPLPAPPEPPTEPAT